MRIFFIRTAAVIAAAGLILAGCNNPAGDNGGYNDPKTLVITGLPADWGTTASAALWNGDDTLAGGTASAVSGGQAEIPLQNISSGGDLSGQWTGSGDYYIKLWKSPWSSRLDDPDYITRAKVSFISVSTTAGYADFITWDEYESQDRGEKIGQISGTITLTGIPDPKPQVTISASSTGWSTSSSAIDLSGVTGTSAENLAWTIPVYANDVDPGSWNAVTGTQTVTFFLGVDFTGDGNSFFTIRLSGSLDMTNKTGISAGSLGTASLASVKLSGTINVSDDGVPIPRVAISARDARNRQVGYTVFYSPSANAQWSIDIPVQQEGAVTFYVYGFDSASNGNQIFSKTLAPDAAKAVSNKPISGIALDIGDISVGRINGTVNFSDVPTPAPYWIGVTAFYHTDTDSVRINGGLSYTVTLDGANGTFTIPRDEGFLAALGDGSATSTFYYVLMQMTEDEERFIVAMKDVPINKEDLSFVELGTLSLSYSALSGTITISDGGNPIPLVVITAVTAQNFTNSVMLYSPSANAPWSINLPAQEGGAVTFHVYGYDSDWNQIFSEFLEPDAAKAVSNQPISGIALNIGDISND